MSRSYLENLSQSLKDQTTGKEQNRYHLEEIGIAGESTILLKLAGSKDCANTFERYSLFRCNARYLLFTLAGRMSNNGENGGQDDKRSE